MEDLCCYWYGYRFRTKMIETSNVWQGYLSQVPQMGLGN